MSKRISNKKVKRAIESVLNAYAFIDKRNPVSFFSVEGDGVFLRYDNGSIIAFCEPIRVNAEGVKFQDQKAVGND